MTPEQFWEQDPNLFWAYWDAYEETQRIRAKEANINAFNQGQYFLLALTQCLQFSKNPKKIYPKEPLPLSCDNKKVELTPEQYQEIRKAQMMEMTKRFKASKNN